MNINHSTMTAINFFSSDEPINAPIKLVLKESKGTVFYEETDIYKIMVKTMKDNIDKNFNMKTQ